CLGHPLGAGSVPLPLSASKYALQIDPRRRASGVQTHHRRPLEVPKRGSGGVVGDSPGEEHQMRRPIGVSIGNHKGGCLKTTVTVNLGAALARAGKKVLLIDLDAQQNLTSSLLGTQEYREGAQTLYDCICDELGLDDLITETSTAGLDVVPCAEDFM